MTARVSMLLKSRASLTYFWDCFLPGRAKDLSAPRVHEHRPRLLILYLHGTNTVYYCFQLSFPSGTFQIFMNFLFSMCATRLACHTHFLDLLNLTMYCCNVHSVEQKSTGLIFRTSRSGSDVRYSCHHNSSRFTFPIFTHSWHFSVFSSLHSITPYILTEDNNTFVSFEINTLIKLR